MPPKPKPPRPEVRQQRLQRHCLRHRHVGCRLVDCSCEGVNIKCRKMGQKRSRNVRRRCGNHRAVGTKAARRRRNPIALARGVAWASSRDKPAMKPLAQRPQLARKSNSVPSLSKNYSGDHALLPCCAHSWRGHPRLSIRSRRERTARQRGTRAHGASGARPKIRATGQDERSSDRRKSRTAACSNGSAARLRKARGSSPPVIREGPQTVGILGKPTQGLQGNCLRGFLPFAMLSPFFHMLSPSKLPDRNGIPQASHETGKDFLTFCGADCGRLCCTKCWNRNARTYPHRG